jgi:hypothetical protein
MLGLLLTVLNGLEFTIDSIVDGKYFFLLLGLMRRKIGFKGNKTLSSIRG